MIDAWTHTLSPAGGARLRHPRARRAAAGFTLLEILIVIAVLALVMGSAVRGFRALAKSDLRASAKKLSGAARYLFDRASTTGKTHRLVIDLDSGVYWAEVSDDKFYLPREKETLASRLRAKQDLEEELRRRELEVQNVPLDQVFDASKYQPKEWKPKRAEFAAFRETVVKRVKLKHAKVGLVYTPRLYDAQTDGQASIYFFPMGQVEPAIIQVSDESGENVYSLVFHPLTGRVEVVDRAVEPPYEHLDDEGKRVEEGGSL